MEYIKTFEKFTDDKPDVKTTIRNLKKLPSEFKEVAYNLIDTSTHAENGKIFGLNLHPDLKDKIIKNNYPDGFSMGIDKDGYFIHTHRGRSKSFKTPSKITAKAIKFIDSTV